MAVRGASVAVTRPRRRVWPIALASLAGVVALVVLGVAIGRSTSDAPEPPAPAPAPAPAPTQRDTVRARLDTAFDALTALRDFRDRFHADRTADPPAEPTAPADPPTPVVHTSTRPKKTAPPTPTPAPDPEPGLLTVDSKPYATIFVDEHRIGDTPLFRISVPAGAHHLRAVLADGRERSFDVQIRSGQESNAGRLGW
jgi:outer membrane biosynthesis protein TonB